MEALSAVAERLFKSVRPASLVVAFAAIVGAVFVGARAALDVVGRGAVPGPTLAAAAALLVLGGAALVVGRRASPARPRAYALGLGAIMTVTLVIVLLRIVLRPGVCCEPQPVPPTRHSVVVTIAGEARSATAHPGPIVFEGRCAAPAEGEVDVALKRSGSETATLAGTTVIDRAGYWRVATVLPAPQPGESHTFEVTAETTADCREAHAPLVVVVPNPLVTIADPASPGAHVAFAGTVVGAPPGSHVAVYGKNEDDVDWRMVCSTPVVSRGWGCAGDVRPRCRQRRRFIGRAFVSFGPPAERPPVAFPSFGASNEIPLDVPPPELRLIKINEQPLRKRRAAVIDSDSVNVFGEARFMLPGETLLIHFTGKEHGAETGVWFVRVTAVAAWRGGVRVGDAPQFDLRVTACSDEGPLVGAPVVLLRRAARGSNGMLASQRGTP